MYTDAVRLGSNVESSWHGVRNRMDNVTNLVRSQIESIIKERDLRGGEHLIRIRDIYILDRLADPVLGHWLDKYSDWLNDGENLIVEVIHREVDDDGYSVFKTAKSELDSIAETTSEYLPTAPDGEVMLPYVLWVRQGIDPIIHELYDSNGNSVHPSNYSATGIIFHSDDVGVPT